MQWTKTRKIFSARFPKVDMLQFSSLGNYKKCWIITQTTSEANFWDRYISGQNCFVSDLNIILIRNRELKNRPVYTIEIQNKMKSSEFVNDKTFEESLLNDFMKYFFNHSLSLTQSVFPVPLHNCWIILICNWVIGSVSSQWTLLSACRLVSWSAGRSVCHNILKGQGS